MQALQIAKEHRPEIPFAFVSGTIGEEAAVDALRLGAVDYILKDRMVRLPSSVRRAVEEARQQAVRRRVEELLRRNEERIREQAALLDHAQDAICVKDLVRAILYWNKGAERLYGWTAAEALGRNADELLQAGESFGSEEARQQVLLNGAWQGELHQTTKDGRKVIVESRWSLLRDGAGAPKSILVINTNITEKKQIEGQFFRKQRLESIGALAGGIAHDLNNALTPVLMGKSAKRASEMVRQILSFSRGVGPQRGLVQVKSLVNEMTRLARETFPRSIEISARVDADLAPLTGNATQLHQVLLNLCVNARDAMPRGGRLTIEAANLLLTEEELPPDSGAAPGCYLRLRVSDTGQGISPAVRERIFEPFFTTKETGHGTGLGLYTVMEIVKNHGGFINLASRLDHGTTFEVFLLVEAAETNSAGTKSTAAMPPGTGELLLLVDKESATAELARVTLETFNYRVLVARNGSEGLAAFQSAKGEISAVLTDMILPVTSAPEMIRALRILNPAVKIIGMSAHLGDLAAAAVGERITDASLEKPFTTEQLLKVLRWVLESEKAA
jgi:PAS domain S-box-containing protein